MSDTHDRDRNENRGLLRRGRRITLAIATAVVCLGLGLLVGGLVSETAFGSAGNGTDERPAQAYDGTSTIDLGPSGEALTYKINDDGLTYGSSMRATSVEDEPDLISVIADDDLTEGFVYKADLEEEAPTSPNDARSAPGRTVKVYEADGRTVIGSFTIDGALEH